MKTATCVLEPEFNGRRSKPAPLAAGNIQLSRDFSPRHVLVVDDEPLIRWSVAETLSELGFDVEQAGNAFAALRKATTAAAPFDVVILDLRLPDMNDLSLLKTLRQILPGASLVLMTAFGTPDVMAEATAAGATVLHKPFELEELTGLVRLESDAH